jgi:hypothetical protein
MWYIYTVGYFSAIWKNEIMSFARKWMKIIMLCEISHKWKLGIKEGGSIRVGN